MSEFSAEPQSAVEDWPLPHGLDEQTISVGNRGGMRGNECEMRNSDPRRFVE